MEMTRSQDPFAAALEIDAPVERTVPLVFSSPHSGRNYPADFVAASALDARSLRRSEDSYVDELFGSAPKRGAPLLKALFPRAYLDVNREPYELDPAMFDTPLPAYVNADSPRVRAGLGTIARVVAAGVEIYRHKLSFAEAEQRIERLHKPYHATLNQLIVDTRARFGCCLLIDCHSMPSVGGAYDADSGASRVDFVLGNYYGASCAPRVMHTAEQVLRGYGYRAVRNTPYAGGYTTRHYGNPGQGIHTLQIEINRRLYMDEATHARLPGFTVLQNHIDALIAALAALPMSELTP